MPGDRISSSISHLTRLKPLSPDDLAGIGGITEDFVDPVALPDTTPQIIGHSASLGAAVRRNRSELEGARRVHGAASLKTASILKDHSIRLVCQARVEARQYAKAAIVDNRNKVLQVELAVRIGCWDLRAGKVLERRHLEALPPLSLVHPPVVQTEPSLVSDGHAYPYRFATNEGRRRLLHHGTGDTPQGPWYVSCPDEHVRRR